MKVEKERNPYLMRSTSNTPHKYYYDSQRHQYFLIAEDGSQTPITKIGTFQSKFRQNKSGFMTHKQRYQLGTDDKSAMHYTPETTFQSENLLYTPTTKKFIGYAQLPYKIRGRNLPKFLMKPKTPQDQEKVQLRKCSSLYEKPKKIKKSEDSLILQSSIKHFTKRQITDRYFQSSFDKMTINKPLPKQVKKTCYNYKCKNLKYFTFDEKNKLQTKFMDSLSTANETLGKSFFERKFKLEKQEL